MFQYDYSLSSNTLEAPGPQPARIALGRSGRAVYANFTWAHSHGTSLSKLNWVAA
jgi:hypothetical protein